MKIFVLRTESILSSTKSTLKFDSDNCVVVPMAILENLYRYEGLAEKKKLASTFCEYISSFSKKELMSKNGAKQANGSKIRLVDNEEICEEIERINNLSMLDKRVFQVCYSLKAENNQVILISQNPVIRFKAFQLGIKAEPFKDEIFPLPKDQYRGFITVEVSKTDFDKFYQEDSISVKSIYQGNNIEWIENMFVNIVCGKNSTIGRYTGGKIVPLTYSKRIPNGYTAMNMEQLMLWECLLAPPEIAPLVVVKGAAGTGKTFCSLAYALEYVKKYGHGNLYNQIIVSTVPLYNDKIGFLPGKKKKKMSPTLGGIFNNLESIFRENDPEADNRSIQDRIDEILERQFIKITSLDVIRGSTIPNKCFIFDETQNVPPSDIKKIVTRAGEGSKFIFIGDPDQIGAPDLNERYNGLVYLSEKLKGNERCWQITLDSQKSVRSKLAQDALNVLD